MSYGLNVEMHKQVSSISSTLRHISTFVCRQVEPHRQADIANCYGEQFGNFNCKWKKNERNQLEAAVDCRQFSRSLDALLSADYQWFVKLTNWPLVSCLNCPLSACYQSKHALLSLHHSISQLHVFINLLLNFFCILLFPSLFRTDWNFQALQCHNWSDSTLSYAGCEYYNCYLSTWTHRATACSFVSSAAVVRVDWLISL